MRWNPHPHLCFFIISSMSCFLTSLHSLLYLAASVSALPVPAPDIWLWSCNIIILHYWSVIIIIIAPKLTSTFPCRLPNIRLESGVRPLLRGLPRLWSNDALERAKDLKSPESFLWICLASSSLCLLSSIVSLGDW